MPRWMSVRFGMLCTINCFVLAGGRRAVTRLEVPIADWLGQAAALEAVSVRGQAHSR